VAEVRTTEWSREKSQEERRKTKEKRRKEVSVAIRSVAYAKNILYLKFNRYWISKKEMNKGAKRGKRFTIVLKSSVLSGVPITTKSMSMFAISFLQFIL